MVCIFGDFGGVGRPGVGVGVTFNGDLSERNVAILSVSVGVIFNSGLSAGNVISAGSNGDLSTGNVASVTNMSCHSGLVR